MGKPQREIDPLRPELRELRIALGRRIRELRQLKGWSQEEFAAQAHIHRTFAGSLERGEKNVSFHALVLIARCFGLALAELLQGLESGQPAKLGRRRQAGRYTKNHVLLREAANLERAAQTLRELALPPTARKVSSRLTKTKDRKQ